MAQLVERHIGNVEVPSSNLGTGFRDFGRTILKRDSKEESEISVQASTFLNNLPSLKTRREIPCVLHYNSRYNNPYILLIITKQMAEKIQTSLEISPELETLLKEAKKEKMTPQERRQQAISFAYGNGALHNPNITYSQVEKLYDELHPKISPDRYQ